MARIVRAVLKAMTATGAYMKGRGENRCSATKRDGGRDYLSADLMEISKGVLRWWWGIHQRSRESDEIFSLKEVPERESPIGAKRED